MSRRNKDNDVSESQTEDDVVKNAVTNAVNSCIEEGIMKGYLEEHAEEVIETLMLQWDNELAMQAGMTVDKIQELTQLSSERIQELAGSLVK